MRIMTCRWQHVIRENFKEGAGSVTAKLRIKTKGIEIEWEGEVEFLKSEVPDLIASIIEAIGGGTVILNEEENENISGASSSKRGFTTAFAAAKLQAKSGPELFKAALAKLQISEGIEPVSRAQILDEMKLAPRVYKPAMRGNLTNTIDGLIDRCEINEPSSGNYVLSHAICEEIMLKLNS
jgi:hypothetical protein